MSVSSASGGGSHARASSCSRRPALAWPSTVSASTAPRGAVGLGTGGAPCSDADAGGTRGGGGGGCGGCADGGDRAAGAATDGSDWLRGSAVAAERCGGCSKGTGGGVLRAECWTTGATTMRALSGSGFERADVCTCTVPMHSASIVPSRAEPKMHAAARPRRGRGGRRMPKRGGVLRGSKRHFCHISSTTVRI